MVVINTMKYEGDYWQLKRTEDLNEFFKFAGKKIVIDEDRLGKRVNRIEDGTICLIKKQFYGLSRKRCLVKAFPIVCELSGGTKAKAQALASANVDILNKPLDFWKTGIAKPTKKKTELKVKVVKKIGDIDLTPAIQKKIGWVDEKGILPSLVTALNLGHNLCLRGRTGTGKTFLIQELAKALGKNLTILNMTTHTSVDEIKGKWVVKPKPTGESEVTWVKGLLVEAMEQGHWLAVEEFNFMSEELSSVFYSALDDRKSVILDEHENEEVKAHKDFRFFATMNWDYRGTTKPNPAIMNRLGSFFDLEYLKPKKEAKLLMSRTGLPKNIASLMTDFAKRIRNSEEDYEDLSTRTILNWGELVSQGLSVLDGAEQTVVPLLAYDEQAKKTVREELRLTFKLREYSLEDGTTIKTKGEGVEE